MPRGGAGKRGGMRESRAWLIRAAWAMDEMKTADLKDNRLNERLTAVLSALGERPTASIQAACGGFAEMTAASLFRQREGRLRPHSAAPTQSGRWNELPDSPSCCCCEIRPSWTSPGRSNP